MSTATMSNARTTNARTDSTVSTTIDSPVGELVLSASPVGLRGVAFGDLAPATSSGNGGDSSTDTDTDADRALAAGHVRQAAAELVEYFAGTRQRFEVALDPQGTEFQLAAWQALRQIPFGRTATYGQQAASMGRPTAVRAVGAANGRNPLAIIVPCHRVIGADGSLTGFAGGLDIKTQLLALEGISLAQ